MKQIDYVFSIIIAKVDSKVVFFKNTQNSGDLIAERFYEISAKGF